MASLSGGPILKSPPVDGPISRLIRSFNSPRSSAATPVASKPSLEPQTPATDLAEPILETAKSPTPNSPTPLERFWKHARRSRAPEEFPPAHWSGPESGPTNTSNVTVYKDDASIDITGSEPGGSIPDSATLYDSPTSANEEEGEPTPQTLARRIQSMISSTPPTISSPDPSGSGDRGGVLTPQTPTQALSPIADSKLLSFLSSPKVMNGSLSRGQQSVWSILERLNSPLPKSAAVLPPTAENESTVAIHDILGNAGGGGGNHGSNYDYGDVIDDGSSMMLYSPLIPQRDSLVELAETEYVSFDDSGKIVGQHHRSPLHQQLDVNHQELQDPDEEEPEQEPIINPGKGKQKATEQEQSAQEQSATSEDQSKGFQWPWSKNAEEKKKEPKEPTEKRVWVPSTTKISLQTTWWGYRIYLPPPVLKVLNDKQLEAAKRAAMITAALKWLLDNIPVAVIPPQLQLALKLVKSLVPLLGYIGGFIAWSWSAIKRFDHGSGVTLTATWLLPIALVPGTWQAYEVPSLSRQGTPRNNSSTQLPSEDAGGDRALASSSADQQGIAPQAEPEPDQPNPGVITEMALPDASVYDNLEAHPASDTQFSTQDEQIQTSIYEESAPMPVDCTSVYHESMPYGSYYHVQQQPMMNLDATDIYTPQMMFFPPPVLVRTVSLPGDTTPPRSPYNH